MRCLCCFCQLFVSKCLGASAYVNFRRNASASRTLICRSDQLCVGRFCSSNMRPYHIARWQRLVDVAGREDLFVWRLTWKSFCCISCSFQCRRNAAHTYKWNRAKPSDSARYVSHNRMVQCSGSSRVSRLFIQRNENCK